MATHGMPLTEIAKEVTTDEISIKTPHVANGQGYKVLC